MLWYLIILLAGLKKDNLINVFTKHLYIKLNKSLSITAIKLYKWKTNLKRKEYNLKKINILLKKNSNINNCLPSWKGWIEYFSKLFIIWLLLFRWNLFGNLFYIVSLTCKPLIIHILTDLAFFLDLSHLSFFLLSDTAVFWFVGVRRCCRSDALDVLNKLEVELLFLA